MVLLAKRRRRRKWSDDEKQMICAQTRVPGVSVSQVARRYDVNANEVFNWLKDLKFAPSEDDGDEACFLPVEIIEHEPLPAPEAAPQGGYGHLDFDLAGGHRLRISGRYDPDALARLIRGLSE